MKVPEDDRERKTRYPATPTSSEDIAHDIVTRLLPPLAVTFDGGVGAVVSAVPGPAIPAATSDRIAGRVP